MTDRTATEYATQRIAPTESGCWRWTGPLWSNGYGQANFKRKRNMAHRFVYELHKTSIPDGLVLDHLCRNVWCVNPDHLEPVTQAENLRRGMSPSALVVRSGRCLRGHEMSEQNTRVSPSGTRHCRTCSRMRRVVQYAVEKAELGRPDRRVRGVCDEPDCERLHVARGLCGMHYQRQRLAG